MNLGELVDALAIEPGGETTTVGRAKQILRDALWNDFQGYKGGWYTMGRDTDVYVSEYGMASGMRVVDVASGRDGAEIVVWQERW